MPRRLRRHGGNSQAREDRRRQIARPVAGRHEPLAARRPTPSARISRRSTICAPAPRYRSRVAGNLVIKALAEIAGVSSDVTRVADHRMVADAAE